MQFNQRYDVYNFGAANVTATFLASLKSVDHIIFWRKKIGRSTTTSVPCENTGRKITSPTNNLTDCRNLTPAPARRWPLPTRAAIRHFPICRIPIARLTPSSPPVQSFHSASTWVENPSPSWAKAHRSWNVHDPTSPTPLLDGFVDAGANDARQHTDLTGALAPFFDLKWHSCYGRITTAQI